MEAGKLRRRIAIVAPAVSQDPYGQPTISSSTPVLRTWARISALTSREIFALGPGFTSNVTHKITIRFPEVAVRAEMHVLYHQRTFRIQAVSDPDESRRELDLICLEQT
jgi:SPP1 family predicted phage head-tail adaptor